VVRKRRGESKLTLAGPGVPEGLNWLDGPVVVDTAGEEIRRGLAVGVARGGQRQNWLVHFLGLEFGERIGADRSNLGLGYRSVDVVLI